MSRKYIQTLKASIVAALYAALVIVLAPISFHAVQVRVADALLVLPFLEFFGFPAVIGLTVGCAIANFFSPYGVIDVAFGSAANFAAGLTAYIVGTKRSSLRALVPTAILQSLIVATIIGYGELHLVFGLEPLLAFAGVFVGSVISITVLGSTLALFLVRRLKKL